MWGLKKGYSRSADNDELKYTDKHTHTATHLCRWAFRAASFEAWSDLPVFTTIIDQKGLA